MAHESPFGPKPLVGHYPVGFGYPTLYNSFYGTLPGSISNRPYNTQVWVLVDQMLVRQGAGEQDGIIVLAGFANNNAVVSTCSEQQSVGLIDRSFWRARPQDVIGLLFNYNITSGLLGKVQAEEAEFGVPFSNGATGIQSHEMMPEDNYNIHVHRGVDFRPEFEYVSWPNAQSNIRHAAGVFGFRTHVEF